MINELNEILFIENKFISNRFSDEYFKKFHPILYNKISEMISDEYNFKEKVYIIYHDITIPRCRVCGKKVSLISFSKGFRTFCSKRCSSLDIDIQDKIKRTNLKKFGVEHPQKSKDVQERTKQTVLSKYGVDNIFSSDEIREKIKKTNLKKYGVDNPFASKEIQDKIKRTNLKKFGVEHNSYSKNVVEKRKQTFIKKYGFDNPNKSKEVINKRNKCVEDNYSKKYAQLLNTDPKNIISTINQDVEIKNYCEKHNSFIISKPNLFNRVRYGVENICTKCNPISESYTLKEKEMVDFVNSLGVDYIRNDRKKLGGHEIDILMPNHNVGIEFNGLYWHSNIFKNNKYHLNKTNKAEEQGIQLLHVFEDEWIYKKEIVKSIIKSKLGIVENKIYARKTEVREINNNKLIRDFLNTNHIQGFVGSKHKIGLFYNNELIALMTFGKKRNALGNNIKNDGEYEMLRFCNKLNTVVIGGASKMLKYFINTYKPKSILSFADRRYSNGNLYENLGFEFIKNTEPNYWYFKKNDLIRYHRYGFRKSVLIKSGYDSSLTEKEIMEIRKYYHIYDSGNKKYVLNI